MDAALAKVDRTTKHIAELSELLSKKRPFRYIFETDEKAGRCSTYAERDEAVISELTTISYDIVQNLRTALDYAYWEIVSPFASNERERKNVQFPFSEAAARLEEAVKNRLAHRVSDAFFKAVLTLAPHGEPGGNELLYFVHDLAAKDRHRFPAPVGEYKTLSSDLLRKQIPSFPRGIINGSFGNNRRDVAWGIKPLPFLPDGIVFKREIDVPVEVVFAVGPAKDLREMVRTLNAMADEVQKTIEIIRAA